MENINLADYPALTAGEGITNFHVEERLSAEAVRDRMDRRRARMKVRVLRALTWVYNGSPMKQSHQKVELEWSSGVLFFH